MKFFRKKPANNNPYSGELAGRIAGNIILIQVRIAHYLNSKTRNWSRRIKLSLLIIFCVLFTALNIFLIIYSIHH